MWRNWQTHTTQNRTGNHVGSSPTIGTKQENGIADAIFLFEAVGLEKEGKQFQGLPAARLEISLKIVQWTIFLTRPEGESHHLELFIFHY